MPTRLNLAFALLCFFGLKLSSQLSHGFYESKRKDSIFVFNDTLWFKIKNADAFNTFAVGKSVLSKKTKKNRVKLHCISLLNELTIVMPIPFRTEDSILTFRFCYKNDSPIGYSTITLLDKNDKKIVIQQLDKDGVLRLERNMYKRYFGEKLNVSIRSLDFQADLNFIFSPNCNYIIKSKVKSTEPVTISGKCFPNLKIIDSLHFEIEGVPNIKKLTFQKKKVSRSSNNFFW